MVRGTFRYPTILGKIVLHSENPIECPICRLDTSEYLQTPCNHQFCQECILEWIEKNDTCHSCKVATATCPYCRSEITNLIELN